MTTTTISAGQTSTGLNIGSGDLLNISSGGTAINTTDSGDVLVSSGGVASSTTVNSGGFENVSGGTTVGTTVNADGEVVVYTGGTTSNTTLNDFGLELVSAGGTAIGTIVTSVGQEQVWGTASGTTVSSAGLFQVSSGGTATGTTVDGVEIIWSSGTASGTTVNSGGFENVSGGTTVGTTVTADGEVVVYTGGTTSNATLNYFGLELVSAGGTAIGTIVTSVGQEQVWGTASGTTVSNAGLFQVWSGGTAIGTTVNGVEIVWTSGTASGTTVNSGGVENVSGGTTVGTTVNSGGNEYVSSGGTASGTTVSSGGNEYVYSSGAASNTIVESGGTATVSSGGVLNGGTISDGNLTVSGTAITGAGLIVDGGTAVGVTAIGALPAGSTGDSGIYVTSGGVVSNSVLESARELVVGAVATGTVVSSGGEEDVQSGGSTVNDVVSSGGLEALLAGGVANNTTVDAGGFTYVFSASTASGTTISSGGVLDILSGGAATDTMLQMGGTIDVAYVPYVSGATATLNSSTDVLTVTDGSNTLTYQMSGSYDTGDTFLVSNDSNNNTQITLTPCFCTGTHILTDRGEIPVERLAVGDYVMTADGAARPVKWVGHRSLDLSRHPDPDLVRPVRIQANAMGGGMPHRDLYISPDHALLLDSVLVPARLLVNGASIQTVSACRTVTYYHVELDSHDILLAENLPAESYLDTGNRSMFENSDAALILHPDLTNDQARRVAQSCRPFADEPAVVEPVWHRLAQRSADLGLALPAAIQITDDPALHVVIGGRTIRPLSRQDGRYVFMLPATEAPIQLVSRATRPSSLRPWVEDRRRLGVMVSGLTLKQGADVDVIPLDHPSLSHGWWDAEGDRATLWRWTDGVATIPAAPGAPALLEVTVAQTLDYPVAEPAAAGIAGMTKAA